MKHDLPKLGATQLLAASLGLATMPIQRLGSDFYVPFLEKWQQPYFGSRKSAGTKQNQRRKRMRRMGSKRK